MLESPNDTVRIESVVVRGQGRAHMHQYSQMKKVAIASLSCIDESILNVRTNMTQKEADTECDREARCEAKQGRRYSLFKNQAHELRFVRAESHANTDLLGLLLDGVGHESVDSDGREE